MIRALSDLALEPLEYLQKLRFVLHKHIDAHRAEMAAALLADEVKCISEFSGAFVWPRVGQCIQHDRGRYKLACHRGILNA